MKERHKMSFEDVRTTLRDQFSWVAQENGTVINAGSTIGGNIGHDLDVAIVMNESSPEGILPNFRKSVESMREVLLSTEKFTPSFCFSRVAWQDLLSHIRQAGSDGKEQPMGIHFLWYANVKQMLTAEPRGLAINLANGQNLVGASIRDSATNINVEKRFVDRWNGIDNVLDPVRLIANTAIPKELLMPTIGHTIERFIIWDILAAKIKVKNNFEIVSREDIHHELSVSSELVKSILGRSRQLRDLPSKCSIGDVWSLAGDIITNWNDLRG